MESRHGSERLEQADTAQINSQGGRASVKLTTPTGTQFFSAVVAPQKLEGTQFALERSIDMAAIGRSRRGYQYELMNYGMRRPTRRRMNASIQVPAPVPKFGEVSARGADELQSVYHSGSRRIMNRAQLRSLRRWTNMQANAHANRLVEEIKAKMPLKVGMDQIQMPVAQLRARFTRSQAHELKALYPAPSPSMSGPSRNAKPLGSEMVQEGVMAALDIMSALVPETRALKPLARSAFRPAMLQTPRRQSRGLRGPVPS